MESSWIPATNNVPQGVILAPMPFCVFFDNLDNGAECTFSRFAENAKLGQVSDTPDDWRNELTGTLQNSTRVNAKFCTYRGIMLSTSKHLVKLVGMQFAKERPDGPGGYPPSSTAKKAHSIPGWVRKSFTSRPREIILPLCSVLMRHIYVLGQGQDPPAQERNALLEKVRCKTVETMKLLEHLWHDLRMRKLGDFQLEWLVKISSICQYLFWWEKTDSP